MEMLQRISAGEWFSSKVSCCSIIVPLFKAYPPKRDQLIEYLFIFIFLLFSLFVRLYNEFAKDQAPIVRQAAAKNLAVRLY